MKILNGQKTPCIIEKRPRISSIGTGYVKASRWPSYQINLWSFLVFNYTGKIRLEEEIFDIKPGIAMFTSPGVFKHHMPAEDSYHYFAQLEFPEKTKAKSYILVDLEEDYMKIIEDWREAISFHINDPLRAEIRIWDMLQRLKDYNAPNIKKDHIHPALKKALLYIELNLSRAFAIPELSEETKVSHCYLLRLFREYSGLTIAQHIKKRRLQMARNLIFNTNMPIKDIAAEVGIPDLHHFNKSVKREFGAAPRILRNMKGN
jgi:AraC-like DNA-binding protein